MPTDSETKTSILIRSYRLSDQLGCEEIFKAGMLEYGTSTGYIEYTLQTDMSDIEKNYMQVPNAHWWVAVTGDDNRVVGQVALQPLKSGDPSHYDELPAEERDCVGELRRMAVASGAQRLGVGSQLLSTLISFAREKRYRQVHLTTGRNMKKACAFYERNGFNRGRIEKYSIDRAALQNLQDPSQFNAALSKVAVFEEGEPIPDEDVRLMNIPITESNCYYSQHYHLVLR